MSPPLASPRLSILIPTYNRAPKLARVLRNIEDELARSALAGQVDVLVSDNASTDSTPQVLASFKPANSRLLPFRQDRNLGMDRNLQFLLEQAQTDYVWFFGDDDILLPGSIARVLEALNTYSPDVLLYSFRQPPDLPDRVFDFPDPVKVIDDPARAVKLLPLHGKLSIHILRRVSLDVADRKVLDSFLGTDIWYIPLALSTLQRSARPRLCVISDVLAVCDENYRLVRFPPHAWASLSRVCSHPFALAHAPHLMKKKRRMGYYFFIYTLFQVKAGLLVVEDRQAYDDAIQDVEFRPLWLLASPKCLLKFLLLKLAPGIIPAVVSLALAAIRLTRGQTADRYRALRRS